MNSYMQKDETRSLSHTIYKTKKWTKNLNIRPETIKLLEGNSIFFNISLNNIFRTYLISQGGGKRKTKTKNPNGTQFSRSVMSDSLRPHGLQHSRLSCPSPTPGVYSNSCPLSRRCHPTVSSSVIPWKQWVISFWGAPKSLQIVTAALKLDTCSLEEKLWPT